MNNRLISACDYYIFIDADDSNKIKARNGRTGDIDFTDPNYIDAVINCAINHLSAGSVQDPIFKTWSGNGGFIFVGPGTFIVESAIILKSNIMIQGSGRWSTIFKWKDNNVLNNSNQTVMKSSLWDKYSTAGGTVSLQELNSGDTGVRLLHFAIDGNRLKNIGTTSSSTPGAVTWGHGLAYYGYDLFLQDIFIHHCPSVGLLTQAFYGWSYDVEQGPGDPLGAHQGERLGQNTILDIVCWRNGQQGYLCRSNSIVRGLWTYKNDAAGLDVQVCGYFDGAPSTFSGLWCFLDGWAYTAYDQLGFEVRLCGTVNTLRDSTIEGSRAGDSVVLGIRGAPTISTNYTLVGSSYNNISGLYMDYPKFSSIRINNGASNIQAEVNGPDAATPFPGDPGIAFNNSVGVSVLTPGNDLELFLHNFTGATQIALQVGNGPDGFNGNEVSGNMIRLRGYDNATNIRWANSANINNMITAQIVTFGIRQGRSEQLTVSGSDINPSNKILIQGAGYSANPYLSHNSGIFRANGNATIYRIAHGLYSTPKSVNVSPGSPAAASGSYYVTVDATNITVIYSSATPEGRNAVQLWWLADV